MKKSNTTSWQKGYGVINHKPETVKLAEDLIQKKRAKGPLSDTYQTNLLFASADRLANAAMWLVVHMTYALKVDMSGKDLPISALKKEPQGHTGGSLNVAIAYVGYLLANIMSGETRSWILGQGHCVAAIEAINALVEDVSPGQRGHYDRSEKGLSKLVADFYSYAIDADGQPAVPLGSHVGPHTAGGTSEGGYLGFAEVQYMHMPLKGEKLIAFLSDGAFEEQKGADWSPRWWRAEDCGVAIPIMILNGRRIEQRTDIGQRGGVDWLVKHLELSGFDPIVIDGHDPVAYACAIIEAETRLEAWKASGKPYPAPLPYIVAKCIKGYGFAGAGTNSSHNLPLVKSPQSDHESRELFYAGVRNLFVPSAELESAVSCFLTHSAQNRARESGHALAARSLASPRLPVPIWTDIVPGKTRSPMDALDEYFIGIIGKNPDLRPRVGNPDELRSNNMDRTLDLLKHRVNEPEPGNPEAIDGAVITALNEEAVIGAALGNKGGINIAVSYEAFAMKMLGALRQDIIFARRQKELGQKPGWISMPLVVSSHTWENGKNEQSHQDPTLSEALVSEMSDTSRVIFPIDSNTGVASLRSVYKGHGQIACLVTPKRPVPNYVEGVAADEALSIGAVQIAGDTLNADIQFIAIGAYQLQEALRAYGRLEERGYKGCVTAVLEPGRFRTGRDKIEAGFVANDEVVSRLFPQALKRVFISHTRPEPMIGILRRLDGGRDRSKALGYINRGGTLDVFGMLFANKCTWAHLLFSTAELLGVGPSKFLTQTELKAVTGTGNPQELNKFL